MEKNVTLQVSRDWLLFWLGPVLFFLILFFNPLGLDARGVKVVAVAALMITWWITESMPMPVVALIPLVLFPLMGIAKLSETAAPYANDVIYLFMGGFMIGLGIEKWNLHKRIALSIVKITGTSGDRIILGFILSTGFISMWISNTATTMMMFPIAASVISVVQGGQVSKKSVAHFSLSIMLAIAYAALFVECYYYGFSMLDYNCERLKMNASKSIEYIGKHKGLAIGNGLVFYLMHGLLFVGWVLAPAYAVIAATISIHQQNDL